MSLKNELATKLMQSFYGCDGGNPYSDIWFCGMEHGGDFDDNQKEIESFAKESERYKNPLSWQDEYYHHSIYAPGNLNRYIAYFYAVYGDTAHQEDVCDQAYVDNNRILYPFHEDSSQAGIGFKINMRPLRFKGADSYDQYNMPDLPYYNYRQYSDAVIAERGAFFQEQVTKYNPKLIICLSVGEADNYFKFFGCDLNNVKKEIMQLGEKEMRVYSCEKDAATIMVIPFMGKPSGPNGYAEVKIFADSMRERLGK